MTPSKDSAYFLGQNTSQSQWLSKPGDYSGATGDGLTYGGAYRIQVSATGRIGVAWECLASSGGYPTSPDDPTLTIFYSESTDGGATWTADPDVVSAVDPNTDQLLNQFAPTDNFDFWFDGETPKFVLERSIWNFSNAPSITYYPNSAILYYKNMLTGDSTVIAHADTTTTVDNPIPNVMHLPAGSQVHIQGEMINFPAIALTPKSGRLAVVYQTYANGDSALVTDDGSTFDTLAYGSIYYSESQDGGLTWGTPTPWLVNSGTGQKYDYRYPQTSYYNPISSGAPTYHLLTSIDSAAGWVVQNGVTPGFDIINFGHATVTTAPAAVSAVPTASAQIAASPNPFSGSTTISWSSITSGSTVLDVRDALGRECFSIDAHKLGATSNGSYTLNPNLLGLAPGVYFVTVSNGASVATEKVVYLQ
ncbi:MAG: T9SS type A sorting domain-containing protein [Bacteroidota bacterium]|nr:T9SS type A sorting domain-containing protein [Bacteroidota bacterium]